MDGPAARGLFRTADRTNDLAPTRNRRLLTDDGKSKGEIIMSREALIEKGKAIRVRLGTVGEGGELAAGLDRLMTEAAYGSIWARPGLPLEDRMICVLSALGELQRLPQLKRYVGAALDLGLTPRAIQEVLIQCGLYGGIPIAENALEAAGEVFAARGVAPSMEMAPDVSAEELEAMGRRMMASLHGERATLGYAAPDNAASGELYRVAIVYGYGDIWFRPGLDKRGRMLCALACFTVMRLEGTLKKFAQSALKLGMTKAEVREAIMQTAPYGGFPVALTALAWVGEVMQPETTVAAGGRAD